MTVCCTQFSAPPEAQQAKLRPHTRARQELGTWFINLFLKQPGLGPGRWGGGSVGGRASWCWGQNEKEP